MHFRRNDFEKKNSLKKGNLPLCNQPEAQFQGLRQAIDRDSK
jgi:hypothetical protein